MSDLSFVNALGIAKDGYASWANKNHNKKWVRKIDGTPIPNDLLVDIAKEFATRIADGRRWPSGRIAADDDGELTVAMALDEKHNRIIIQFGNPTDWIGLDLESAEALVGALHLQIGKLKHRGDHQ